MEYKWNPLLKLVKAKAFCLNPCFNGIQMELRLYTRTHLLAISLNPCFNGIQFDPFDL